MSIFWLIWLPYLAHQARVGVLQTCKVMGVTMVELFVTLLATPHGPASGSWCWAKGGFWG